MDELPDFIEQYLVAPGDGVYTVHTAKERKLRLQTQLYGQGSGDIQTNWQEQVKNGLRKIAPICLLGICSDTGGGILRGANWGPLFIRSKLLEDGFYSNTSSSLVELGDIRVIPHLLHDKYLNDKTLASCRQALYKDEKSQLKVSPLSIAEDLCQKIYQQENTPRILALGGDHSVSYPLVKTYLQAAKKRGVKAGLIHFDAHTDLLEQRLGIDICFASWTTHILKELDSPNLVHQIGIRSSGHKKDHWEKTYGINQHWSHEIKDFGAEKIIQNIIATLKAQEVQEVYISFDIDALDAQDASATGTPEANGIRPHEAALMIKAIGDNFVIGGADMVEVAPFLETENAPAHGREITVKIASALTTLIFEYMQDE